MSAYDQKRTVDKPPLPKVRDRTYSVEKLVEADSLDRAMEAGVGFGEGVLGVMILDSILLISAAPIAACRRCLIAEVSRPAAHSGERNEAVRDSVDKAFIPLVFWSDYRKGPTAAIKRSNGRAGRGRGGPLHGTSRDVERWLRAGGETNMR